MSFHPNNLTLGRGEFNTFSLQESPAQHIYASVDTFAMMTSANYFPPYLGTNDPLSIRENDSILIISSTDNQSLSFIIKSVNPFVISPFEDLSLDVYTKHYFGAADGNLTFAFSRLNRIVTFYMLTNTIIPMTATGHLNVDGAFQVPLKYQGDSSLYPLPLGVVLPFLGSIGTTALPMDIFISSNISIAVMPNSNFAGGQNVSIRNFSQSYIGYPS